MTATTSSVAVELGPDGAVVVVKRPREPAGSARIGCELRVLEAARHPGVVDLVDGVDAAGAPAVVTRWVGPHTLAAVMPPSPAQAAGIMAALADCVADLHEMGVLHGAISADHVIFTAGGQPVLCGFGGARLVPPDLGSGEQGPADDVAALGRLLRLVAGEDVEVEPIPQRRGWRRRPRWLGYQRRTLLTLADQATLEEPHLRPTARALAAAIHDSMPDATLGPVATATDAAPAEPSPSAASAATATDPVMADELSSVAKRSPSGVTIGPMPASPPDTGHRRRPRLLSRQVTVALLGSIGVVLVLFGVTRLGSSHSGAISGPAVTTSHRSPITPVTGHPAASTPGRPILPTTAARHAPSRRCPGSRPPGVDLDADGCPDHVRITGSVVEAAGVRYDIGQAGDKVLVADWRCDGRATPAVLRPATGEVFVFPRWATGARPLTITPVTRVSTASGIQATGPDRNGCRGLRIRTATGAVVAVKVGSSR